MKGRGARHPPALVIAHHALCQHLRLGETATQTRDVTNDPARLAGSALRIDGFTKRADAMHVEGRQAGKGLLASRTQRRRHEVPREKTSLLGYRQRLWRGWCRRWYHLPSQKGEADGQGKTDRVAPETPPGTTRPDALLRLGSERVIVLAEAVMSRDTRSGGKRGDAVSHRFKQMDLPSHAIKRILLGMVGQGKADLGAEGRKLGIGILPEVGPCYLHEARADDGERRYLVPLRMLTQLGLVKLQVERQDIAPEEGVPDTLPFVCKPRRVLYPLRGDGREVGNTLLNRATWFEQLVIERLATRLHEQETQDVGVVSQPIRIHFQKHEIGKGQERLSPAPD